MIDIKFVLTMGSTFTFLLDTNDGIRETMGRNGAKGTKRTKVTNGMKKMEGTKRKKDTKMIKRKRGMKVTKKTKGA